MGKLIDSTGKKILLGTVLYNGDTTSNFTLNDDYINYDYIEVVSPLYKTEIGRAHV